MTEGSLAKRLGLATALPVGVPAAAFINGLLALTVFLRLGAQLAEDQDALYPLIGVLLLTALVTLIIGNARNWTENQLLAGLVAINFPAALFGLAYLFPMPEVDIVWEQSTIDIGWDPFGQPAGVVLTMLFLSFQCVSLILNVVLLRKMVTARTTALDTPARTMGFMKTTKLQPGDRSDLLVAGVSLAIPGLIALLFGGANTKFYMLLSCAFQLLEVALFPFLKRGLASGPDAESVERVRALEPSKERRKGVPGRVGLLAGYMLMFLLAITQFVQKNDQGRDVEYMVGSMPNLLFGIALWLVASWLLAIWGFNGHLLRCFIALGLTIVTWGVAFADETRSFTIFQGPAAWIGAGVVLGICLGGIWELLWPLPRWNVRRVASNFSMFIVILAAFANGLVQMYINTTEEDIYLIIFISVAGLCALLGLLSSLIVWLATWRGRAR